MLKNQSDTANILRERSKLNKRLAYEGLLVHMHAVRNSLVGWNIHLYWGTSPGDSSIKVVSNIEFSKTIASPLGVACLRLAEFI